MPTYQYLCTECGEPLEAQQSFSEPSLTECPSCSGRLRKVFNAVGVVFKGSGFYRNDSRGADPATSTSGSSGDKADSSGSGDAGKGGDSTKSDTSDGGSKKSDSSTPAKGSSDSKAKATTPA